MQETPKISVIIPVYKVEPYLRQCLDSVVNQTYRNLEIILIDDGSPDNSGAICDEYARQDERIMAIHKENEGQSAARNQGMSLATGEWLAFVDSDDWLSLDYYEGLVRTACAVGEADVICAGGHVREEAKSRVVESVVEQRNSVETCEPNRMLCSVVCIPKPSRANLTSPWDKLYRREYVNAIAAHFEGRAWEDIRFNIMVFSNRPRFVVSDTIGYHYRIIPTSIVNRYNPEKPRLNYEFLLWIQEYLTKHNVENNPGEELFDKLQVRSLVTLENSIRCNYFHPMNQTPYGQVAAQIKEMKALPLYHQMIWEKGNPYYNVKQRTLRFALRLPWLFPTKLLFALNESCKPRMNAILKMGGGRNST